MKRLCILLAALLAGCAAPANSVMDNNHPASPQAAESPPPAVATALAAGDGSGLASTANTNRPGLGEPTTSPAASGVKYVCRHHPDVLSDQPGQCPKCNMKLTPATNGGGR